MGNCLTTSKVLEATLEGEDSEGSASDNNFCRHFVRETNEDIFKKYKMVDVLGNGSMGFVAKAKLRRNVGAGKEFTKKQKRPFFGRPVEVDQLDKRKVPSEYAVKSIIVNRVSKQYLQELKNEIEVLRVMDHPNIVKAREVYYHRRQIYIVMELCDGGDLYCRLPYSEKQASSIVTKLLSATKYMHDHGIVHRDLKFENIMFEDSTPNSEIKVVDFGLSKKFLSGELGTMNEGVGTMYTMAPQVLLGEYTSQADLWSVGVITYMLLVAHRPFYHPSRAVMVDRIMKVHYNFNASYWNMISYQAKDFVSKLLVYDPEKRYDSTKALKHKWLSKDFECSDRKPDVSVSAAVGESLLRYQSTGHLKKLALNVVANLSSPEEIRELRKCFDMYDTSKDGLISYAEFREGLKSTKNIDKSLKHVFDSVDVNSNSMIDYTEFLAAALETQGRIEEERIAEAFDRLDCDNHGYISKSSLKSFLGDQAEGTQIEAIIREGDEDNDGKISYQEFLNLFRKNTNELVKEVSQLGIEKDEQVEVDRNANILEEKFETSRTETAGEF